MTEECLYFMFITSTYIYADKKNFIDGLFIHVVMITVERS